MVIWLLTGVAYADNNILALCKSYVNIRESPSAKSRIIGYLDCGDGVETDWVRNGDWLHCVNLSLELTDGWVYAGYIVEDQPEFVDSEYKVVSSGRVALRKMVCGKRRAWIKSGKILKVLWRSNEWSLTNRGYIKSEFLEVYYGE